MTGALEVEPNDPSWFLYTPYGAYRGWMRGAVRSVSIPWLVRQFALRDWARYSEVHGLPQKKAKVPAMASAEDKRRFFNAVKRLGAETAFLLPQPMNPSSGADWDVELLEAKDTSWLGFEHLIERCDKSITLCIRGTNLTTEVKGGSFAAAKTHREEDSDYAIADAKKFAMAMRKQVFMLYCLYNYGDAALAPIVGFDAEPVEDRKGDAEIMVNVSTALKTFKQEVGWELDDEAVAEQFGIPLKKAGAVPAKTTDGSQEQEDNLPEE
jgi:phage gp29-like protein